MVSDWQCEKPNLIKGFYLSIFTIFLVDNFCYFQCGVYTYEKLLITKLPILS